MTLKTVVTADKYSDLQSKSTEVLAFKNTLVNVLFYVNA